MVTVQERHGLESAEANLEHLGLSAAESLRLLELEEVTAEEARSGLAALETDIRRHHDIVVLIQLGSEVADVLTREDCPTCHKPLDHALLGPNSDGPSVLDVDTSLAVLEQRRSLYRTLIREADRTVNIRQAELGAVRSAAQQLRDQIRALKDSLSGPSDTPSVSDIHARLELRVRLGALDELRDKWQSGLERLNDLARHSIDIGSELRTLREDGISPADHAKLAALEVSFRSQLREYGFQSCPIEEVILSPDNYMPTNEGFELVALDFSASDNIRLIWAYLLGLLEVSSSEQTNHPGLVVFDEPRQQATARVSMEALLRRASSAASESSQVFFATSEPGASLESMLRGTSANVRMFTGKILEPM